MQFDVIKTSIVNLSVDAIVLPANEVLKEGSGTSRAIFEAAGRKNLIRACKEIGHCDVGKAIPTLAYDLDAKYIIHAVVPKWIDGNNNEYALLSSAYLAALNIADVLGCVSIAFPLLASGNNGFDRKLATKIAEESIAAFEGTKLKKAVLVVYGDTAEAYMRELGYNVAVIPGNLYWDRKNAEQHKKRLKIKAEDKKAAQDFLEKQISKAIEWIDDPQHQKVLAELGGMVFKRILKL